MQRHARGGGGSPRPSRRAAGAPSRDGWTSSTPLSWRRSVRRCRLCRPESLSLISGCWSLPWGYWLTSIRSTSSLPRRSPRPPTSRRRSRSRSTLPRSERPLSPSRSTTASPNGPVQIGVPPNARPSCRVKAGATQALVSAEELSEEPNAGLQLRRGSAELRGADPEQVALAHHERPLLEPGVVEPVPDPEEDAVFTGHPGPDHPISTGRPTTSSPRRWRRATVSRSRPCPAHMLITRIAPG